MPFQPACFPFPITPIAGTPSFEADSPTWNCERHVGIKDRPLKIYIDIFFILGIISIQKEAILIKVCPYLEFSFQILAKKWNGLIIHYLSLCPNGTAHFSEIKRDLPNITSRALSLKLSELVEYGLIEKKVTTEPTVLISYELTEKGRSLTEALEPIQKWAQQYKDQPK